MFEKGSGLIAQSWCYTLFTLTEASEIAKLASSSLAMLCSLIYIFGNRKRIRSAAFKVLQMLKSDGK
jgi:hypothetical protein